MAVIGSYGGASIIAFPKTPGIRQISWTMNDSVAIARSPYTGATQTQVWPGGDWWEADVALPQMNQHNEAVWSAFLAELRGMANVFYLGDPLRPHPCGLPQGNPVVDGVNNAMSQTLHTRGWKVNSFRLLLPGDLLQIGYRLHKVLDVVNSDASGKADISIWPSIREATTDGQQVILNNPQGLFRLSTNRRSVTTTETRLSAVTLKIIEAR